MKNKKSIKIRILKSTLILVTIILFGIFIAFNVLLEGYINSNANKQINLATDVVNNYKYNRFEEFKQMNFDANEMKHLIKSVEDMSYSQGMIINEDYNLIFPTSEEYYIYNISYLGKILESMEKEEEKLEKVKFEKISTDNGYYYISVKQLGKFYNNEKFYIVLFIDITEQLRLAKKINSLLFITMCIAGILTILTTIILSEKISRPIKTISRFAKRIGSGDFTQLDVEFEDKELDELLKVMNKSAGYLEEYDKSQKTFFQNISHELRTPLMSMVGYAEAIKYNVIETDRACNVILEEGDKLKDMIDELLYISRMDNITQDYPLSNCDLKEVLYSSIESKQATAINKNIKLVCNFDEKKIMYMCEEKSLRRAFLNIIENALRYAQTRIITSCKDENRKIIITIENDGPKIKEEDIPYIFDRFYKGEKGKSGIGLAIVKSIIEKHEGCIYCKNTQNGVKFVIELKK